jgi:hypothetical protein
MTEGPVRECPVHGEEGRGEDDEAEQIDQPYLEKIARSPIGLGEGYVRESERKIARELLARREKEEK